MVNSQYRTCMSPLQSSFASLVPAGWKGSGGLGGTTTTIAAGRVSDLETGRIFPPFSEALLDPEWRLSIAELTGPSAFSSFPGYDRTFTVIGAAAADPGAESAAPGPVELSLDGSPIVAVDRFEQERFAGEATVDCVPPAGTTRVLNLFTRRDAASGVVRVSAGAEVVPVTDAPRVLVALEEGLAGLGFGDCLWVGAGERIPAGELFVGDGCVAVVEVASVGL
jgi:environmental stress-induced protein Ves